MVISKAGSESALSVLVAATSLPTFQDSGSINVWEMHQGGKDDFFVYDVDGKLSAYFMAFNEPNSDLSTEEGYGFLKEAIINAQ